jgi:hypothetical protein
LGGILEPGSIGASGALRGAVAASARLGLPRGAKGPAGVPGGAEGPQSPLSRVSATPVLRLRGFGARADAPEALLGRSRLPLIREAGVTDRAGLQAGEWGAGSRCRWARPGGLPERLPGWQQALGRKGRDGVVGSGLVGYGWPGSRERGQGRAGGGCVGLPVSMLCELRLWRFGDSGLLGAGRLDSGLRRRWVTDATEEAVARVAPEHERGDPDAAGLGFAKRAAA